MSLNFSGKNLDVIAPPERIVNGYEVEPPFKYPSMVSLFFNDGKEDTNYCGGTLLNGNTIITAAHCAQGTAKDWTAKVHRHDLNKSDSEEGGNTYKVLKKIDHPGYQIGSRYHDISIWKINADKGSRTDVELDTGRYGKDPDSILATIGWGRTGSSAPTSKKLMEVKVPIFDHKICARNYYPYGDIIDEATQVCAGYPEGGMDSCGGDSGGPLFKYEEGRQVLIGITSFGEGCALPDLPGIYTRVSNYTSWIMDTINNPNF